MENTGLADKGLTDKVLNAYSQIEDPRLRIIVSGLIRHLHEYVKDTRVTDQEFEFAWGFLQRMSEMTGPERNEFILLSDVIGVSQLIETLNHEVPDQPVGFALVGPFFREGAPFRERSASIASDDTPGTRVRITGRVLDFERKSPISDAIIDIWQAATNGLYENQDEHQPDYNLRGRFRTDESGSFEIVALMPTAYPVPTDGPVGKLLEVAKRPPMRPAHIHFIVTARGHETLVTQIFVKGDPMLEEDVVFTASRNMVGDFRKDGDYYLLEIDFPLKRGKASMPKAPVPAEGGHYGLH